MSVLDSAFYAEFVKSKFFSVVAYRGLDPVIETLVEIKVEQYDNDYDYTSSSFNPTEFVFVVKLEDAKAGKVELNRSRKFRISTSEPFGEEVLKELDRVAKETVDILRPVYDRSEF